MMMPELSNITPPITTTTTTTTTTNNSVRPTTITTTLMEDGPLGLHLSKGPAGGVVISRLIEGGWAHRTYNYLFYNIFLFMLYVVFLKIPSNPTPIPTTATLFRGTYFPLILTRICANTGFIRYDTTNIKPSIHITLFQILFFNKFFYQIYIIYE